MNCKYYKIRTKKGTKYCYCTKFRKVVDRYCKKCSNIEYKDYKPIKKRTYSLAKKEKKRFSIIYPDLTKCAECGLKIENTAIEKNEVFSGSYRQISMKDGMVVPLCHFHHDLFHKDREMNLKYKVMFQKEYMKTHTLDEFIQRYGQNYIYVQSKKYKSTI